jgi:hypothetical protein
MILVLFVAAVPVLGVLGSLVGTRRANFWRWVFVRFGSGGGLQKQRQQLPVFKHRKALLYLAEKHGTTIVLGETGSGKSTQIPQVGIDCSLLIDFLLICFSTIFVFDIFFHCHNCSSHDENPNQMQIEADRSRNLQLQRIISIWVQLQISCNTS